MLKTSFLISNKDEVIKLLSKRGFDANNMVNEIIVLDIFSLKKFQYFSKL